MKPRLLDLFCGAGGAAMGYARAGFEVIGVDKHPQPNYPFEFFREDALRVLDHMVRHRVRTALSHEFDAIHASPPCQAYSSLRHLGKGAGVGAPDLVGEVRELLEAAGLPYIIENVPGAPLRRPVRICGSSIGLDVRRHRLFETNFPVIVPPCAHGHRGRPIAVYGDHPEDSQRDNLNRARTLEEGQQAMGIDWMPWKPLTQAIPPRYTELIGEALMAHLNHERQAA